MKLYKDLCYTDKERICTKEYNYIPSKVVEEFEAIPSDSSHYYDKYVIQITEYCFEEHEDVQYCVLGFSTVEKDFGFSFKRYYPLVDGENMELLNLFRRCRTIRIYGNYIDFNAFRECKFRFRFTEEDGKYKVSDIQFLEETLDNDIDFSVDVTPLREMLFKGYLLEKYFLKMPDLDEIKYNPEEILSEDLI